VEAAAQDPRALGLGGTRSREADVRVHGDAIALGTALVVRAVELLARAQRRARPLVAADHELLLGARDAVPELDAVADDAHHLVGAADRPGRLAGAAPDPRDALHLRR